MALSAFAIRHVFVPGVFLNLLQAGIQWNFNPSILADTTVATTFENIVNTLYTDYTFIDSAFQYVLNIRLQSRLLQSGCTWKRVKELQYYKEMRILPVGSL